ncbi:class I adenylate-forming enzyme family protein [Castellaniella denitrificans]|uniref:class I adenylate-forming enzyme family protein n=1 Tax=Castellaniella denitrificans TaxID=56119 RepID=UPI001AC635ED|nr:acyl--CoA ligase [Burkholderiales bacterium]
MNRTEINEFLKTLDFGSAGKLTLPELLEKRAQATPDAIAVRSPVGSLSFGEWLADARAVAALIRRSGAYRPNTPVLVWVDTADARKVVAAQHGVLDSGCIVAPLDDRLSVAEVRRFAQDVAATAVIVSRGLLSSRKDEELREFVPDGLPAGGDPLDLLLFAAQGDAFGLVASVEDGKDRPAAAVPSGGARPGPDDCALLAFTSGTTGRPKAAMITHGGCVQLAERMVNGVFAAPRGGRPVGPDDAIQSPVPAYLPTSIVNTLYAAVLAGCPLSYRGRRFDPEAEEREMALAGTTIYAGAPAHYAMMCQRPASDDSRNARVQVMTASGAPMTAALYRSMRERWPRAAVANWYALNETMVGQTLNFGRDMDLDPTAIGKPVWPTELAVVDESGKPCAPGESGEVLLRAPGQMVGYYLNEAETARRIDADGWVHTEDIGFVGEEDGLLRITGRKSDRINRGGFKFYPAEVEEVLLGHEDLADAAVLAIPDPILGQDLVAMVVAADGGRAPAEADVRAFCQSRLSRNKVPSRVYFVDRLPRSGFGKVVKKELIALWEAIESRGAGR